MSLLGFPVFRYIDVDDSEEVIRAIHMTDPEIPLDLVLHTPGGLVLAAPQIARAANEIVMSEHAVLGPVDPQLGQQPAASILNVLRQKPIAEIDDETLILADQAEKAVAQMEQEVGEVLTDKC